MSPDNRTLRELYWMANGKAEMMGLTSQSPQNKKQELLGDPAIAAAVAALGL